MPLTMNALLNALAVLILLPVGASVARADQASTGIGVTHAWLRATPHGAPVAGGYATITNAGKGPDRLVGASLPMARTGEVHSMSMANGVMHMRRLDEGLEIAPGATVTLTPGGYHLMFEKPTAQLKVGQRVAGTMTFEKAGTIPVTFDVAGMAAKTAPGTVGSKGAMPGMDMQGMDMKGTDMKGMDMGGAAK